MIRARPLIVSFLSAVALAIPIAAQADEQSDCTSGDGTLLVGTVVAKPTFVAGKLLMGIPLTHTHIRVKGDADGRLYDLAVDDVFAAGYDPQLSEVPSPLNSIGIGDHLEACGLPYAGGMHWVHTNCGDTPTAQDPNGWLKAIGSTGSIGPNLEDSQRYCYLWPKTTAGHHSRHRPKLQQGV